MWGKIVGWFRSIGVEAAISALYVAEPYLVMQIRMVEGKIGDTPEKQAGWIIKTVQKFLRDKFKINGTVE